MAALDELMQALRAEGALDSEGHFTLDREQARAKMQKFQLADARRYVLELVQAAVLRGAEVIEFEIDADDMRMRFAGLPFTAAEIDDLYGSLFGEGDSRELRGLRQLALALNAALGMDPKFVHLRSGEVELRSRRGAPDEIQTHDSGQAVAGTQIHVRQRLRPGLVLDFLRNLGGRLGEEQHLRERCVYSRTKIVLDGETISEGLVLHEPALAELRVEGEGFSGVMKLVPEGDFASLRLVKDGVWVDTRRVIACGTHLLAVVEGEELRKDVSQAKIVSDEALETIVAALAAARWRLWAQAREQARGDWKLDEWIRVQLLDHITLEALHASPEALALAEGVEWEDCRGVVTRTLSLRELVEQVAGGGGLRYATRRYQELEPEGEGVPLLTKDEVERLARLLETQPLDVDAALARETMRTVGREAWLERRGEPELPTHVSYLVRGTFEREGVRGEAGIEHHTLVATHLGHPLQVSLYKQGCLLGRLELELGMPNWWLALEADFEASDDYRDAVRDLRFARALLVALAELAGPFAQLLELAAGQPGEDHARGLVKRWLIRMVDPAAQNEMLARVGVEVEAEVHRPVAELLPELSREALLSGASVLGALPLFHQLEGPLVSLAELAAWHEERGHLPYLDSAPEDPRITAPKVAVLGPGDRKIVRGLLGEACLEKFDTLAIVRRLRHLAQPAYDFNELRARLLARAGEEPRVREDWLITLGAGAEGEPLGCLAPELGELEDLDDRLHATRVEICRERRPLCELELELGWGPLIAIVDDGALTPDELWEGVVRDQACEALIERLRHAAAELFERLVHDHDQSSGELRRWLNRVLLHAAARGVAEGDRSRYEAIRELRLLETVSGMMSSCAELEAMLEQDGEVQLAEPELGWAPVRDPEVIKAGSGERAELEQIFGDRFADGGVRVRQYRSFGQLESRPEMVEAVLADDQVLVRSEVHAEHRRGEIGISARHREGGLRLRLGTVGFLVEEAEIDGGFHIPLEAAVIDDELPLDGEGEVERKSRRYRRLLRQLRRSVPGLVCELADAWGELDAGAREQAWAVLLTHMQVEAGEERRAARERAFGAASRVPGFCDLWGGRHGLAELVARSRHRPLRALLELRPPAPEQGAELSPMLLVSEAELACLRAHTEVELFDDRWEQEQAWLARVAAAPEVERPDLDAVALVYRKAQVAGGLECELWIPRGYSALEPEGPPPELIAVRGGRELGRLWLAGTTPCAGFLSGDGLRWSAGEVEIEPRSEASLLRQVLILYLDLAGQLRAGRLGAEDHERALDYFAWVDLCFGSGLDEFEGVGKRAKTLRKLAAELVPPTLRESLRRSLDAAAEDEEAEGDEVSQADDEVSKADAQPAPAPQKRELAPAAVLETPQQRLLGALWEQLQWARERHAEVLDELSLSRLHLAHTGAASIAELRFPGIAVNMGHPLVARLLEQEPHDLVDLSFVVAAIYTLMNHCAEAITDAHERQFVAELAETLALALRAGGREPAEPAQP